MLDTLEAPARSPSRPSPSPAPPSPSKAALAYLKQSNCVAISIIEIDGRWRVKPASSPARSCTGPARSERRR
jgi:hypothetical protein